MAARPKTLTTACMPVVVGLSLAYLSKYKIDSFIAFCTLMAAICITIGTNLINDALDFKKGTDSAKRIGFLRVTQAGLLSFDQVYKAGFLAFSLAIIFGIPLIIKGGVWIALLLLLSVFCGYFYTGGTYPLAYIGVSEVFVLVFYGILSTQTAFYLQSGVNEPFAFLAGLQIGALACVILAINNLRDHEGDKKSDKKTLAVRFGVTFGRCEITVLLMMPFILNLFWLSFEFYVAALLPWLIFPIAVELAQRIWETEPSAKYNEYFGLAAFIHLIFGLSLALGLTLS